MAKGPANAEADKNKVFFAGRHILPKGEAAVARDLAPAITAKASRRWPRAAMA
jgi:hypothetical protein